MSGDVIVVICLDLSKCTSAGYLYCEHSIHVINNCNKMNLCNAVIWYPRATALPSSKRSNNVYMHEEEASRITLKLILGRKVVRMGCDWQLLGIASNGELW